MASEYTSILHNDTTIDDVLFCNRDIGVPVVVPPVCPISTNEVKSSDRSRSPPPSITLVFTTVVDDSSETVTDGDGSCIFVDSGVFSGIVVVVVIGGVTIGMSFTASVGATSTTRGWVVPLL